jgi:hypothetical protein
VFTFAIECYYFGEDNDAANASKAKLLQNWKEHATAIGVQLRESPVNANIDDTSLLSKHPGHVTFGSCYIGVIPFGSFRHFDIFSVSKIIALCICLSLRVFEQWLLQNCIQVSNEVDDERQLNDELDDREAFEYELLQASQLRVCACCGQERNGLQIPDKVFSPSNKLFSPLCGDLVLIVGEPIRVCNCCADVLKTGQRPKWAIRFPAMDKRFTRLTPLEFRLVSSIDSVNTLV